MRPGEETAVFPVAAVRDLGMGGGESSVAASSWEASGVGGRVRAPGWRGTAAGFGSGFSKRPIKRKPILSGHLTGRLGTLNRLDAGWGANRGRAGAGEEQKAPPVKGLARRT